MISLRRGTDRNHANQFFVDQLLYAEAGQLTSVAGVFDAAKGQFRCGPGRVIDELKCLRADPRIKGITVTGSERAGSTVAAQAGKNLKKSTMELGGSDAFIVLEDAELGQEGRVGVSGRMNNTGQCCVASKRFIVVEQVADAFIARCKAALEASTPGDRMDAATKLGPLCSEPALVNLLDQLKRSVAAGSRFILGGERINRTGAFMQPSILTDIQKGTPAYLEEFFAPLLYSSGSQTRMNDCPCERFNIWFRRLRV